MPELRSAPRAEHPYDRLTPDLVLDAIERFGFRCNGALQPLASYENRVYLAGTEEGDAVVAKFYRPGRWSDAAIGEEHGFAAELAEREIPVVAPLPAPGPDPRRTLVEHAGFRVAVYPRLRGHAPELTDPETLRWMGRFIGRIHAVGSTRRFRHRPAVSVEALGREPLATVLAGDFLPAALAGAYEAAARALLEAIAARFAAAEPLAAIRLHGDCHAGNVLWADDGPHFVDLDDCRSGPAVQDLWMLLSGDVAEMEAQLGVVLAGYRQFHDFDPREITLIEPLRGLRGIHYAAWLATRWQDPAFPRAFPWFGTERYWEDETAQLRDQLERLDLPLALHV